MDDSEVRKELKRFGGNLSKVSRELGLEYQILKEEFGLKLEPIVTPTGPMPQNIKQLGKKGLQQFVIAVKANGGPWPVKFFNAIETGRRRYDEGTFEMCQEKRNDGWIVLYLIPRKVRQVRPAYFRKLQEG